ncbi:MAG: hypothetical protein WA609_07390 [Terriglobales bacterium]
MKAVAAFLLLFVLPAAAQNADHNMDSCPMHKEHMKAAHQADVEKHGDVAMGFPQDKTTHHFRLYADGGAIEVRANDSNDAANRDAIRAHMTHIAKMFASGDFSIPMFVHGEVPPGVPIMKEKRTQISYSFQELPAGASVRIKTENPDALAAIHDFLRFQIEDHHTGDAATVRAEAH